MNKWIAEFDLEDGDTMPEHMDLEYKGVRIDFHCRPLEQEPRWISVSERLPNDNRKQLVYTKYGTYDIATYRKNKKEWMVSNEIDTYICGIIAWMPLPKPYEPQENEE